MILRSMDATGAKLENFLVMIQRCVVKAQQKEIAPEGVDKDSTLSLRRDRRWQSFLSQKKRYRGKTRGKYGPF